MSGLLAGWPDVGLIALRTLVVYAFILVGLRLSGKREVGHLTPFDLTLILLIANAVQNAMVGPDTSLVGGLVAAGVLLAANGLLGRLAARHRRLERLLRGSPRILVHRGRVEEHALREEQLSHEQLSQALRENGTTLHDCRLAVLEVDGTISVMVDRPRG